MSSRLTVISVKRTHESKYGNQMYFAEAKTAKPELHFEIVYDIVRHERLILGSYSPHLQSVVLKQRERSEFLAPDRLVPVTGLPAQLAAWVTESKTTNLDKGIRSTISCLPICAMTRLALAGVTAMCCTHATPKKVTVRISIPCSLPWRDRKVFHLGLKLDFRCLPTSIRRKSWISLLGRFLRAAAWLGSGGHFRSLEASGEEELFLWSAGR